MVNTDAPKTVRKFNDVLDALLVSFGTSFDRTGMLSPSEATQETWYRAGRDMKIAYLPPGTHHSQISVPSIHVRIYHEEWRERVEEIYRRHGLTPEITDHDLFGKIDIDANLS